MMIGWALVLAGVITIMYSLHTLICDKGDYDDFNEPRTGTTMNLERDPGTENERHAHWLNADPEVVDKCIAFFLP